MQVDVFDATTKQFWGRRDLHDLFPEDSRGVDGTSAFLSVLEELSASGIVIVCDQEDREVLLCVVEIET